MKFLNESEWKDPSRMLQWIIPSLRDRAGRTENLIVAVKSVIYKSKDYLPSPSCKECFPLGLGARDRPCTASISCATVHCALINKD